ncbi:uncharacterized protein LOC110810347 isoform X2 [Carica papaya]|uniref:uncharacterized protein LOC110810347 isoform X2 n=1 Tax=Carica papaya TaxID=3649 RepID=UPI000B8D0DCB|nr:uncharacterized protein LOC110810347 isoform X2 [Carica papaya]
MESQVASEQTESWTDEKHLRFLNNMEAAFVLTMLADNGRLLPLDRHLPDSSESTLDLKTLRRKKHATNSVDFLGTTTRTRENGRPDKRSRRLSSQPCDSSQDQR